MENLKQKTIMVVDSGQFISFAESLTTSFKKVLYYKPFQVNGFPHTNDYYIGFGYNVECVESPFDYFDEVELYVFTDLFNVGLQDHLRSLGKAVFGAGKSEMIETDRFKFRKVLEKANLAHAECVKIKGISKLESYLKTVKNKYVKISKFRNLHETWRHISYEHSKSILDDIKCTAGNLAEFVDFVVESNIDSITEIGYDGFICGGEYPENSFFGVEIKDCCYIGKTLDYEELPKVVRDINKKCAPFFKDYYMFYSNEIRLSSPTKGYLTDPTCRLPSPCSEIYQNIISNLADVVWEVGHGRMCEPKYNAKFGGELIVTSELLACGLEQCITIPKEIEPFVKLRYSYKYKDNWYCIPQKNMPEAFAIVATGDSVKEVTDKLKEYADKIIAHDLNIKTSKLDDAEKELEKLKVVGVQF